MWISRLFNESEGERCINLVASKVSELQDVRLIHPCTPVFFDRLVERPLWTCVRYCVVCKSSDMSLVALQTPVLRLCLWS